MSTSRRTKARFGLTVAVIGLAAAATALATAAGPAWMRGSWVSPVATSLLALSLLIPAVFRRQRRRSGAAPGSPAWRRRALAVASLSALLLATGVGGIGGVAAADNDPSGVNQPTADATASVLPDDTPAKDAPKALAGQVANTRTAVNLTWLIVGGILVLFMQAGFALVETGFTRAKNANHTMMMNLVIFALGVVGWWVCGYAFMFGSASGSTIGLTALGGPIHIGSWNILSTHGFFLAGHAYDYAVAGFFFFQLVFMDATATIPTGAMAERWKFTSFCLWGLFASMILYPLYGNWVWGGGWLSQLGAQGPQWGHGAVDFAGSGVVHAMGGVAAFWGAKALGPRIGKYAKDGTPRAIPGHHIPMAFLGSFVLLVGWMGFNGASTFAATDFRFTIVIVNTILASAAGCLTAMAVVWRKFGQPDPSMTINVLLAGLVAITAPCAFVTPWAAVLIGIIAGIVMVYAVLTVDQKLKVDDPVGAVAVHGMCGLWGVLAVGIFADGTYGAGLNGVDGPVKGLLYGDGGQFMAQLTSAVVLVAWCSLACIVFFAISKKTIGMRVTEEQEVMGLNAGEMGLQAYPNFMETPEDAPRTSVGAGSSN